jgi:hypothetical protein
MLREQEKENPSEKNFFEKFMKKFK